MAELGSGSPLLNVDANRLAGSPRSACCSADVRAIDPLADQAVSRALWRQQRRKAGGSVCREGVDKLDATQAPAILHVLAEDR